MTRAERPKRRRKTTTLGNDASVAAAIGKIQIESEDDSALLPRHAKNINIRQRSQAEFFEVCCVVSGSTQLANDGRAYPHVRQESHARGYEAMISSRVSAAA